jgi:hypothetical protein
MELAIIGGLAALGLLSQDRKRRPIEAVHAVPYEYRLPEDTRFIYDHRNATGVNSMENPRVSMYLATNSYQQPNVTNVDYVKAQEAALAGNMAECAVPLRADRRAAGVGVVRGATKNSYPRGPIRMGDGHPTAPFFKSGKSQFHSNENSSRRVEFFTGKDTLRARAGNEAPGPMFKPTPNVNTGQNMVDARKTALEHVPTSAFRNNEVPVPSQMVGPGIGLAPDAPPSGGFHPFLRILPDNVGQYKNNLPGGLIVGGQPITEGPERFKEVPSHKAPKTAVDYNRKRPGLPSSAPYIGKVLRPDVLSTMQDQSRSVPLRGLQGPAGTSATNANIQRFDGTDRDGRPRNVSPNAYYDSVGGANVVGPSAPGAYAEGKNTHLSGKREGLLGEHAYINTASPVGEGPIGSIGEFVRPRTLRQVADGYGDNALSINATRHASAANRGDVRDGAYMRDTLRSTTATSGYAGNAVGAHSKQVLRNAVGTDGRPIRQTGRATLGDTSYAGNMVGPNPQGPKYGAMELPPERPDRSHGPQARYPGPQARYPGMVSSTAMGRDSRFKPCGLPTRPGLPTDQRTSYSRDLGATTAERMPSEALNSRFSELTIAKKQLAKNPYSLSIQDVYT